MSSNSKTRVYTVPIIESLDSTIKRFVETLKEGEEITDTSIAKNKLIIITEVSTKKNLLLG